MPLSEDEQRILHEIERSFYEHDPAFAREVSSATLARHASRNCKWAAAGFLVGLVILLTSFASMFWLGALGFLVMLASAVVFVSNARRLGRAGLQSVTDSVRAKGLGDMFGDQRDRLKKRFNKDDK